MKRLTACALGAVAIALAGCSPKDNPAAPPLTAADVDEVAIISADETPGMWLSHGRTYSEQRFSPLKKIDASNVGQLGLAWYAELDADRGMEATPIVVGGVMYVTSAWSMVYALDARTGERMWSYDPGVDKARGQKACCDVVNRGVAVWKGKVYVGTIDGRLIALDAATGKPVWEKVTVDQSQPYTITGAPRVMKGKVLIGNGGGEFGVRGYMSAYDAETGDLSWRFYFTPNPKKEPDGAASDAFFADKGNATWGDDGVWTESGGGGTAWDAIVYDPDLDLVYIGVGNGTPWNRRLRDPAGGDNLLLSSIVALRPDTGEYVWHYQTTPGESWDYTATQPIVLAELEIGGAARRVLMQAPKNGYFYVLDRQTGELISADKYSDNSSWTTGVDMDTGRPVETANARYETPQQAVPGPLGNHNWHPMSFNPSTGLVYLPVHTLATVYAEKSDFEYRPGFWNTGTDFAAAALPTDPAERLAVASTIKGDLVAWDPIARKARWTVPYPFAWNGGTLTTAGDLVFEGAIDGKFRAYNAETGDKLWEADAQYPVQSGPVTYTIDGEQYVATTAGWGSALPLAGSTGLRMGSNELGRVLVYKIGGTATLPEYETVQVTPQAPADDFGNAAQIAAGKELYFNNCMVCHGDAAQNGGITPDLRWSAQLADAETFAEVVFGGSRASRGMASFTGAFSPEEAEEIRAYIVNRAHEDLRVMQAQSTQ